MDWACTFDLMPRSLFTKSYRIFREELVKAREAAGVSQEELAKRIGWDRTFISKVENGVRRLDVVELLAICDALGINATEFVAKLQRNFGR